MVNEWLREEAWRRVVTLCSDHAVAPVVGAVSQKLLGEPQCDGDHYCTVANPSAIIYFQRQLNHCLNNPIYSANKRSNIILAMEF